MDAVLERARRVRIAIFDVDGALTDGCLYYGDDGQEFKAFHARDGLGIKMLQETGVEVGIITGRTSGVVTHRMSDLGIAHVYQGQIDKAPAFERLLRDLGLVPEQAAYLGDDVVDLPILRRAGLAASVADGHPLARSNAHWVAPSPGGRGAARDLCELIMRAQGTFDRALERFMR